MQKKKLCIELAAKILFLSEINFTYSCPNLVVPYTEEIISRPFLDENRFRLVSQDRISAQNGIGYLLAPSGALVVIMD